MAETPKPPPEEGPGREPLIARLMGAGARGSIRVAEATGIDRAVEEVAEEAVSRALESPAAERAIARALESEAVERSIIRAIDSEMIDRVWERLWRATRYRSWSSGSRRLPRCARRSPTRAWA